MSDVEWRAAEAVRTRLHELQPAEELGADPSPALRARHPDLLRLHEAAEQPMPATNIRGFMPRFVGRDTDVR